MAGKQGGGEGGSSMDGPAWMIVIVLVIGLSYLFWIYHRSWIIIPMYTMDSWQYMVLNKIHLLDNRGLYVMQHITDTLAGRIDPKIITFEQFYYVMTDIANRTIFVWMLAMIVLTGIVIFKMKGEGFKKNFTLTGKSKGSVTRFCGKVIHNDFLKTFLTAGYKNRLIKWIVQKFLAITFLKTLVSTKKEWKDNGNSFIHYQAESWPVSLISAKFDPNKDDPVQAAQRRPLDWMRDNGIGIENGNIDALEAERIFSKQLGLTWSDIHSAPRHVQAIMILSALNLLNGSNDFPQYGGKVEKLRDRLAIIYANHYEQADELVKEAIAPYMKDKLIINGIHKKANKYAYIRTACVAIYGWGGPMGDWGGGKAGILSSSMFRWLKRVDRTLWYALNNVGRRKYHIEGAGVVNHFFTERLLNKPQIQPHVTEAVDGLQMYVSEKGIFNLDEFYASKLEKDFEL